ncbi:MAG TPA: FAD-dependent oxidoreductase [Clostridiaceae bacterium]|nr:FAD-dependent oxidoreductase [Clostridiaceae bacterium]
MDKKYEELYFDFVVIGGGIAGICTALSAARNGVKTALIHDRPVLGGNSSSEVKVICTGAATYCPWSRETGIIEEIMLKNRAINHSTTANSQYDLLLYETVTAEPNLTLFLNTAVRTVECENIEDGKEGYTTRIISVGGYQLGTEKEFIFYGKQFADCTGDATVGFLAGAEFRYGREARSEFGEYLAPIEADDKTMGNNVYMIIRDTGKPVPYIMPSWGKLYTKEEEIGILRKLSKPENGESRPGHWWLEIGYPYHTIYEGREIYDELLKHIVGIWNYLKNYSEDKKAFENYALEWVGSVIGKRESRRLVGDVLFNEHHCHKDQQWPDRVCYSGYYIDLHVMGGILNREEPPEISLIDENYRYHAWIVPTTYPLRAFYSRNIENLWMAGRDISVTHVALGTSRLQSTIGNQGQAVGTAAAYAILNNLTPRQTSNPNDKHIKWIQQKLLEDDMNIPGVINEDEDDLARKAIATASSESKLNFGEEDCEHFEPLNYPLAQVFPVTHNHIDKVSVFLKNELSKEVEVEAELQEMERIWDNYPGKTVAKITFKVPANYKGWFDIVLNATTTPNKPHRISLSKTQGLYWARATKQPIGTYSQFYYECEGGCKPENKGMKSLQPDAVLIPPYKKWVQNKWFSLSLKVEPVPLPYGAANVNNGLAWPIDMPNLWVSDEKLSLPQYVELDLRGIKEINEVHVTFDTNLNVELPDMPALWRFPSCIKHWRLYANTDRGWELVYEEKDNYQRKRKIRFNTIKASHIRVEAVELNNMPVDAYISFLPKKVIPSFLSSNEGARIFEIRVYNR